MLVCTTCKTDQSQSSASPSWICFVCGSMLPGGPELVPGFVLGACRLERKLGQGGMGQAWLAHHLRLDSPVVVQLDEPSLSAALAGRLTGVTSLTPVHPVDESVALGLLDDCVAAAGTEVALHSCASEVPWKLLQRSTFHAVSVDASTPGRLDLDGLGEFVDAGRTVLLGLVAVSEPAVPPSARTIAETAAAFIDRLGFPRAVLPERIGVTPGCGLAGATPGWARTAIETAQQVADMFADEPDDL